MKKNQRAARGIFSQRNLLILGVILLALFFASGISIDPPKKGKVLDQQGNPVPGAFLVYYVTSHSPFGIVHPHTQLRQGELLQTDNEGVFTIPFRFSVFLPFSDPVEIRLPAVYSPETRNYGFRYSEQDNIVRLYDDVSLKHKDWDEASLRFASLRTFLSEFENQHSVGHMRVSQEEQKNLFLILKSDYELFFRTFGNQKRTDGKEWSEMKETMMRRIEQLEKRVSSREGR